MDFDELKVGAYFKGALSGMIYECIIKTEDIVILEKEDGNRTEFDKKSWNYGFSGYIPIKPLNYAASNYNQQSAKSSPICKHKNTKQDRYFSAKVYITCADCGEPLN